MSYYGNRDFLADVSFGLIPGYRTDTIQARSYGLTTTEKTAWQEAGDYVFPTTASTLTVVSDSTQDSATGTGASSILITGLNSSWAEISEVRTLNGTTPVVTTQAFLRVNRTVVITKGSGAAYGATNVGIIRVSHGANVLDRIDAGTGLSSVGVYSCAAGKSCKFQNSSTSMESNKDVITGIRSISGTTGVRIKPSELIVSTLSESTKDLALAFGEKTDIEIRVNMTTGTGDYRSSVILLVRDT